MQMWPAALRALDNSEVLDIRARFTPTDLAYQFDEGPFESFARGCRGPALTGGDGESEEGRGLSCADLLSDFGLTPWRADIARPVAAVERRDFDTVAVLFDNAGFATCVGVII